MYAWFWHIMCVLDVNSYCRLHEKRLVYKKNSIIGAIMFTRLRIVLEGLKGRLEISMSRQWETHRSSILVTGIIYKKWKTMSYFFCAQCLGITIKILWRHIYLCTDIPVYISHRLIVMQAEQSEIEEKLQYLEQDVGKVETLLSR